MTIRRDTYEELKNVIKHQQYIIKQLELAAAGLNQEIKSLKQFPDAALKVAAEKILLNKNLRKESMKRWKGGDDE